MANVLDVQRGSIGGIGTLIAIDRNRDHISKHTSAPSPVFECFVMNRPALNCSILARTAAVAD